MFPAVITSSRTPEYRMLKLAVQTVNMHTANIAYTTEMYLVSFLAIMSKKCNKNATKLKCHAHFWRTYRC